MPSVSSHNDFGGNGLPLDASVSDLELPVHAALPGAEHDGQDAIII